MSRGDIIMKIKNIITGIIGGFILCTGSVASVSAASISVVQEDFSIAQFSNPQDIDSDFLRQVDDAIYLNSSIRSAGVDKTNSFWVLAEDTGTYYLQVIKLSPRVESGTYTLPYTFTSIVTFNTVPFISTYNFTFSNMVTNSHNSMNHEVTGFYQDGRSPVIGTFKWKGSSSGAVNVSDFSVRYSDIVVVRNYNFPYDPILSPILDYPYNLDIQSQSFTEWLISTEKYLDIYHSLQANHVSGFVEVFREFGGSASFFKRYCKGFFDFNNIGQGVSDYNLILRKTKALYQEYLRLKNDTVGNHLAPRVESTIVPETNDNNTVLVTNAVDDTTIISLLRDILRSLIALPNTLNDFTQLILNKLDSLDLTTNIVNDGGSGITDFSDLYVYDVDSFNNDLADFEADIEDVQSVPMGYISNINQNSLMPEKMLEDKDSLIVNVPTVTGFTVGGNGSTYSTQTGSYVLRSVDYPWLDTVVQKIKRYASILLILGYLVHLRYRIPELVRGE